MAHQQKTGHSVPYTFNCRHLEKHKINCKKSNKQHKEQDKNNNNNNTTYAAQTHTNKILTNKIIHTNTHTHAD